MSCKMKSEGALALLSVNAEFNLFSFLASASTEFKVTHLEDTFWIV